MIKLILTIATTTLVSNLVYASCASTNPQTTPIENFFLDDQKGTALDYTTNLMWTRCQVGKTWSGSSCDGTATTTNWRNAHQIAQASEYGGYSDWRIPNIKEILTIVEYSCSLPALNTTIFPNTPNDGSLWSSTTQNNELAFAMQFNAGYSQAITKSIQFTFLLVRDKQ